MTPDASSLERLRSNLVGMCAFIGRAQEFPCGQTVRTRPEYCTVCEAAERLKALAEAIKAREAAEQALDARDEDNPCADALNLLWRDIIIARNPKYGDWEYPGQAYRHLLAEHKEVIERAEKAEAEAARLRAAVKGLADRWRDHADKDGDHTTDFIDTCMRAAADELEALLSPAQEQP